MDLVTRALNKVLFFVFKLIQNEIFTIKVIVKYFTLIQYNGIVIVYWH